MHPVAPQVDAVGPHVIPGQEADAADDDQQHDGHIDDRMAGVAHQGYIGSFLCPHQIKARVAEGGDGMKHRHPYASCTIVMAEDRQHHQRADDLDGQRHPQDEPCQPDDAAHLRGRDGLLHGAALHERDFSAGQQRKGRCHRDHAQAADLDEQKDHRLSKPRPVTGCILHHQAGDAYG